MILSPRLKKIADKVIEDLPLADIGTDHAYLPSYLYKTDKTKRIIATDINKGPLKKAQLTLNRFELDNDIELRLGPGLEPIKENEVDQIIISGMGGDLIASILEHDLNKAYKAKQLILQPQSSSEHLRKFLNDNNFKIISEDIVVEDTNKRHYYEILTVTKGEMDKLTENELLFGYRKSIELSNDYLDYINFLIKEYKKRLDVMKDSNNERTKEKFLLFESRLKYLEELNESLKNSVNN